MRAVGQGNDLRRPAMATTRPCGKGAGDPAGKHRCNVRYPNSAAENTATPFQSPRVAPPQRAQPCKGHSPRTAGRRASPKMRTLATPNAPREAPKPLQTDRPSACKLRIPGNPPGDAE